VGRFVAQSFFAGYDRVGGAVKTEDDPFGTVPPPGMEQTVGAIRHVEDQVLAASWTQGVVLRYGGFYGPHTSLGPDGEQTEAVRRRKFPIAGDGGGVWSFIHIADAADATVAAIERGAPGVYNVVDDEPASVATWLPVLAESLRAKAPMRVPRLVGRLLAGETGAVMMTELRGASNAKARRQLGWTPAHATWRDGFRELGAQWRAESGAAA
jgi:nucleoside-diphosphate-sugar epimerase